MEKLTEIYNELLEMGVTVQSGSYHLDGGQDAFAIKVGQHFGIFLDIDRIRTLADEKEATSHEWAHVKADATYGVDAPPDVKARAENRAARTQIEKILPFEEMREAMRKGYTSAYDLAEYFAVTEATVNRAYAYYTGPKGLKFDDCAGSIWIQ